MTEPIQPLRRSTDARRPRRRASDSAPRVDAEARRLPVPTEPEYEASPTPTPHHAVPEATYAAHLLGQKDARRGLRGGQETLEAARSAYLGAEYSGQSDRRPGRGIMRKTEI